MAARVHFEGAVVPTAATTPAGADTQVQFNDGGAFGASSDLTFSAKTLSIGTTGSGVIKIGTYRFVGLNGAYFRYGYDATIIGHEFTANGGTLRLKIFTGGNIIIGSSTDLGAKLGIKGSGATSATTAVLVQNSASTNLLTVLDDGKVGIGTSTPSTKLHVSAGKIRLDSNYNLEWGGSNTLIYGHNTQGINFLTQGAVRVKILDGGNVGIGETSPTAKLQIKGSGATSATTAVLVQNSAGTQTFKVDDLGDTTTGGSTLFIGSASTGGVFNISNTGNRVRFGTASNHDVFISGLFIGRPPVGYRIGMADNGAPPTDISALVTMTSTTKGFLPPRMTSVQLAAIASPAAGLQVYDTTTNNLNYYNGTAWVVL